MTAAITWAVLATVGGIVACAGWWFADWCGRKIIREAREIASDAKTIAKQRDTCAKQRDAWRGIAVDLEVRLRDIKYQRHLSAKHARAAQLAAKRLQVVGKAAEINREMGR
jgi:hypothetical protein